MPTITLVKLSRKFNLRNYETIELGLECHIFEGESPQQALAMLEAEVQKYMKNAHPEAFPKPQQAQVHLQPQQEKMAQLTIQEQLEKLRESFGDLADSLSFTIEGDKVLVKPRQFLGSEKFAQIASIVHRLNGIYVSAGKESRFELSLKNTGK